MLFRSRRQIVGNRHQAALLGDHHFGITAIVVNAGVFLISTIYEIAIAAGFTVAAASSKESNTDAIANCPPLDAFAKFVDDTNGFMSRDPRPGNGKSSLNSSRIRMTNTAGLDPDAHETCWRVEQWLFCQFQLAGRDRLYRAVRLLGLILRLHSRDGFLFKWADHDAFVNDSIWTINYSSLNHRVPG